MDVITINVLKGKCNPLYNNCYCNFDKNIQNASCFRYISHFNLFKDTLIHKYYAISILIVILLFCMILKK